MVKIEVEMCVGTSCHLMGSQDILAAIEDIKQRLPIEIVMQYRTCMKNCANGPTVRIGGKALERASAGDVVERIQAIVQTSVEGVESDAKGNV